MVGENSCGLLQFACCPSGFNATVGFDAVTGIVLQEVVCLTFSTGFGSPNYLLMAELVLSLR